MLLKRLVQHCSQQVNVGQAIGKCRIITIGEMNSNQVDEIVLAIHGFGKMPETMITE